ncbi:hypothetical protein, partial [Winogradskyella sp. 4-2091]|uniref:hypothetical protein n=1 Tax=Winogradskyella sp. 4-2091 TaxID=3381659 RepID=UPI003892B843
MKLKLPKLYSKNNLFSLLFALFCFSSLTAQITPFEMRVIPTDEVCTGNGILTMDITDTQEGAEFEFVIYQLPDTTTPFRVSNGIEPSGPDFTTFQHIETSFPAGNYRVIATQTLGTQTNQETQEAVINDNTEDLIFTATETTICGGGEITANVTTGTAISYELRDSSNTVIIPPQASDILTPVPPGDHIVVVIDACGDEFTQGITISTPDANYGFYRYVWSDNTSVFRVLQDCNNYLHTERISFNGSYTIPDYVFPIEITITVEDPSNPGSPTIINDTWASDAQNDSAYTIPFYTGESYDYTIEISDNCGNTETRNETIDADSRVRFYSETTPNCGLEYFSISRFEGVIAPIDVTFTTYPVGFDPNNYRSEYALGTYSATYTDIPWWLNFGSTSNPLPNGSYVIEVSDSCGTTFTETISLGSALNLDLTQTVSGGCDADEGNVYMYLRNTNVGWSQAANISSINITSAPSTYPNPIPYNVSANISSNGRFAMTSLPTGEYTFEALTSCGNLVSKTFTIPSGEFTHTVTPELNCGSFNVSASITSWLFREQLWLQKYYPDTDEWGHPETNIMHTVGTVISSTNAMAISSKETSSNSLRTVNGVLNNVLSDGLMRVVIQSEIYRDGESSRSIDCRTTLETFTVPVSGVKVDSYYLGNCSNGNSELVIAATGVPPLNFSIIEFNGSAITPIDNGDNPVFSDLTPGEYTVQIEDSCFNVINVEVNTGLAVPPTIIAEDLCDGEDGFLFVQGVSFLDIEWTKDSDPTVIGTGNTLNLSPYNESVHGGTYYANLSYASNPAACANQTLSFTTPLSSFPDEPEIDVTCNGGNNFDIEITSPTGPDYEYKLNGGSYQSLNEFSISSGDYTLYVTNTNTGCEKIYTNYAIELYEMSITEDITNVACKLEDSGAINITVSGGKSPYTFEWSNLATSEDLTDLYANTYTVTVTDAYGCVISKTIEVTQPDDELFASSNSVNNVDCNGNNTGSFEVTASGGTGPYTFTNDNGTTSTSNNSGNFNNLIADNYTVTIEDDNGCTTTVDIEITEPDALNLSVTKVDATSTQGCDNGSADASATGGTAPYTYLWSASASNQTTANATNLPVGDHTVVVTDANDCTTSQTITISCTDDCDIVTNSGTITNVLCNGNDTGAATVSASSVINPTATFTFTWSNGDTESGVTSSTISDVVAGNYTVSVTMDGSSCDPVVHNISITQPSEALSASINKVDATYIQACVNGSATVTATGGTAPYTYEWSASANNQTTATATNLPVGNHSVIVIDDNGCKTVESIQISCTDDCDTATTSGTITNVLCFGEATG